MECVSSVPLATCLTVPPNATQQYASGVQRPWTSNSSHAALFDCMRQWTFGKGTAAAHGHHFYLESPPISPRSGPTQLRISIPHLNLEDVGDSVLLDVADSLEEHKLDLSDESDPEHLRSLLSTTDVKDPVVLQGAQSPLDTRRSADSLEARSTTPHRDNSYDPETMGSADKVITRNTSKAVGQATLTEFVQALQVPSEGNATTEKTEKSEEENGHSCSLTRLTSPESCRSSTSITRSTSGSTESQAELLADKDEGRVQCDPDRLLKSGGPTKDPAAKSDDNLTLSSPAFRLPGIHRIDQKRMRRPQLTSKTRSTSTTMPQYDRRMRVGKPRTNFSKRHPRLHRSHSTDSSAFPKRQFNADQSDFAATSWKEQRACSIGGTLTSTKLSDPHLLHGFPATIPDDQSPNDAGPPSTEPVPDDTFTESFSSYDEMETDVSDIERPHPLDSQRDQIVNLLLRRYMSYRSESQQQDAESRGNDTGSVSKTRDGQSKSNTSRGKQAAGQKRKKNSGSQEDDSFEDDDEAAPRRRKRRKGAAEESSEHQSFACPFSKKSPSRYRRCYRYALKRIRDVKQHLRRCHRRGVYCPVCSETFDSEEARDTHVRQRTCVEKPGVTIEGISDVQAQGLSVKCSTKISAEKQWFQVFGICFPGHAHPRSPYVDRNLSEELQSFRDYASVEGPSIILEEMRGLRRWNEEDTAFLRQVLSDGLERIADLWSQGLDSDGTPELKSTSPTAMVSHPSLESSTAASHVPPQVSRPSRDFQGADASASSLRSMQEQLLGISSSGRDQHDVDATQAENSIYDFDTELFDISMLSTDAPAMTAPGDAEFPIEIWPLRYGPNVELAT